MDQDIEESIRIKKGHAARQWTNKLIKKKD